jgi:hypothetical protein
VAGPGVSLPARRVRRLGRAEQVALVAIALTGSVGAEWDLLLPVRGARVPVTVWWDEARRVDVRAGAPWTPSVRPATIEDVARRGAGRIGGAAGWDPEALGLLDEALGRLSPGELEALRGVEYVRGSAEPVGPLVDGLVARYAFDEAGGRIEVFDAATDPGIDRFVGSPEAPLHAALHPILHELGHALSDAPARRAQAEALEESAGRWRASNPVTAAYAAVAAEAVGPTRYGRTAPAEGFAEAFALYHLDPEALLRVMPGVHAWFAAGEPLEIVRAGLPPR